MPDDIATLTQTSITLPIDGKDYEFGYLNTYDKAEFVREYRRHRKALIIENRTALGASPEQICVELDDLDIEPPPDWSDWHKWLLDDEAIFIICKLSLRKKYPVAEVDGLVKKIDFTPTQSTSLVRAMFGKWVKWEAKAPPTSTSGATYGDGGPPPNEPPPTTYGTPAETTAANA